MSRSERGEYRGVRRVLLDGPDFQRLSADARLCFLVLKITGGPTGIGVEYAASQGARVAQQTGLEAPSVTLALDELTESGWFEREGPVYVIVGHLKHEPLINSDDKKHRKSVHRYLSGMPRLEIVRRFVATYPEWFPVAELSEHDLDWTQAPSKGHGSPIEGPSKGLATTEYREPSTENGVPTTDNRGASKGHGSPIEGPSKVKSDRRIDDDLNVSYAIGLTAAANAAITEMHGEQVTPLLFATASNLATECLAESLPLDVAQRHIRTQVARCSPSNLPRTMQYFAPGLRTAMGSDRQREIDATQTVPKPNGTNGIHRKNARGEDEDIYAPGGLMETWAKDTEAREARERAAQEPSP